MNFEKMTSIEKEAALNALYKSPNGLEKIAAVMLNPIIRDLLHEGRVRQCFAVDKLQQGMDATYDSDVSAKACVVSSDGVPELCKVESSRFIVPTGPIGVQAGIKWVEANYRKFDIINRTQERSKSALQSVEDQRGFNLIDFASTQHYTPYTTENVGFISLFDLAYAKARIEKGRVPAAKLALNPVRAADILMLRAGAASGPLFLPETSELNLKKGVQGSILGMTVLSVPDGDTVTRVINNKEVINDLPIIDNNNAYILGKPEMVGVFAVRQDITVETQKMVDRWEDVFAIYEIVGWGIRYAKGMTKITLKQ